MLIGYARVSTDDQNLDLQRDALEKAGCEKIYTDQQSGASTERLGLNGVLEIARAGDTLVVWRLDRLGRSLTHRIQWVEKLEQQGIGLRSLQENIDTTTCGGRLVFHLFGALAECYVPHHSRGFDTTYLRKTIGVCLTLSTAVIIPMTT